jgi:hypothetical protein
MIPAGVFAAKMAVRARFSRIFSTHRGLAMDCKRDCLILGKCLLAAVALSITLGTSALAEPAPRRVYNPMTQRTEPEIRPRRVASVTGVAPKAKAKKAGPTKRTVSRSIDYQQKDVRPDNAHPDFQVEQASYESDEYYDTCAPDCGCDDVCTGCGDIACGNCVTSCCSIESSLYIGFEATFVKPRFESNQAFTVMTSDGALFETFNEIEFDYDMEFTPRAFVGWQNCDGLGWRATWWQFDHSAADLSANPPANGFGEIALPPFGDVDISSNIATDTFSAVSDLNAYAVDLEATKQTSFASWNFGVGGGIRYASSEQHYFAQVRETGNVLRDQVDYQHSIEGIGPTISIDACRPWSRQLGTFCKARGSVLFGDGESRLIAGEDLDLANSFTTTRTTGRDDLLSIAEIQVGIRWQASQNRNLVLRPFLTSAFEGQIWNGAGNATSEEGNLGFFGFTAGGGLNW